MLYTAAPSTRPVASNPTLRIAVNSSADRAEPQVPLWRISAIRAAAAGGSPSRRASSVTGAPFSRSPHDTRATGQPGHQRRRPSVFVVAILRVPLPVPLLGQFEGAAGFLPRGEGTEPGLAPGGTGRVFYLVALEAVAVVLALVVAHGH